MNLPRTFLSICAMVLVAYVSFLFYKQEKNKRELGESGQISYAEILELSCGRRDYITFRYVGKEVSQRIYLSNEECATLSKKSKIGIKVDGEGDIVFANNAYNDDFEAESISILALGASFIFCIFYYGILPKIKKREIKQDIS